MKHLHLLLLAAFCLPLFFSCQTVGEIPDPEEGLPAFPKPAEQINRIPLTRSEEGFVQAGNEFAWRLTRKLWDQSKGSMILSPLSVQYALGMLGNGADEAVAAKLAAVLGYEGTEAINAYCAKMIECLPMVDTTITLALANGVIFDESFTLKLPFKTAVTESYDALVESMPFTLPELVKKRVNDWCEKHTYGRIKDVLDSVDPLAFMYLMNAIYFNAKWTDSFDANYTKTEDFKALSGRSKKVKMMHKTFDIMPYAESESCQTISLSYGRGAYSIQLYLPKQSSDLAVLMENPSKGLKYETCKVILSLPCFETEFKTDLLGLLVSMGLPTGSYNELIEENRLNEISKVIHKANITVNEKGTEAAAVTVIEMKVSAAGPGVSEPRTVYFTADHPFLYTITENSTGAILFTGVYTGD